LKNKKKYPVYFYFIALIIPIILLGMIEVGLQFANYGNDYSTFIKLKDNYQDFLFFNPKLPQKYFPKNQVIPSVIPDGFLENKPENCFRVFVLGESSVAGFPYPPNASFPRYLKRKLELLHPEKFIEVVNLGVSAINTNFIRERIDDIIEQKPDLILIYTGHNEYYGVTGVSETSGIFRDFFANIKNLRMYQLVDNLISEVVNLVSPTDESSKTLMALMVKDKLVEYKSDIYRLGLRQFEDNLNEIIGKFNDAKIPVFVSTLISNDMISPLENSSKTGKAEKFFQKANYYFQQGHFNTAKYYYLLAKRFDELRFRAPEEMNTIIKNTNSTSVIDAEKYFRQLSGKNILVKDFFVDHLHLNIESNKILADLFLEKIYEKGILRKTKRIESAQTNIDKLLALNMPLTRVDSSYSDYSLFILINSYPFTKNRNAFMLINNIVPKNFSDSLALDLVRRKISWEQAHIVAANYFYKHGKYFSFYREMDAMIEDKPFEKENYYNSVNMLLVANQDYLAFPILKKLDHRFPDSFSSKKLGELYYRNNQHKEAIKYFERAEIFQPNDPEVFFRLSGSYFFMKDTLNAIKNIKRCIELKPDYPNAERIYNMLVKK
jgi:tetratricopeptide (TPR) repeat protein